MLGDLYLRVKDLEYVDHLYARLKEQYGFFDAVRDLSAKMDLAEGHIYINKNVMWYLCRRCRRCLTAPFRLALRVVTTSNRKNVNKK
jgi:hypothetical protein